MEPNIWHKMIDGGLAVAKNIVICCDGTGNEISENISNVLKLYRTLRKTNKTTPHQVVFYDPGVGTLARPSPWTKFYQDFKTVLGLATGYGLDDRVLEAYKFLIDQYETGDEIYLFGFSRGAHTVRVLAALIHKIGLLAPQQENLADAALTAYKQTRLSDEQKSISQNSTQVPNGDHEPQSFTADDRASQFARIVSSSWPTIKFLGVWDTVASVIVPRPDRFYTFSLEKLAYTEMNPSVKIFRQAIAIDERRRMFRLSKWEDPQNFMHNRFSQSNNSEPQDIKQVWFTGVHADVGGGYPEKESGQSKFPLLWMIDEAVKCGLAVNPRTVNHLAKGIPRAGSPFQYVPPDAKSKPHDSMSAGWRLLEWIPKLSKYKEWKSRKVFCGFYIPDCEPRPIPDHASIHQSVICRMKQVLGFKPINLPADYQVVPCCCDNTGGCLRAPFDESSQ